MSSLIINVTKLYRSKLHDPQYKTTHRKMCLFTLLALPVSTSHT